MGFLLAIVWLLLLLLFGPMVLLPVYAMVSMLTLLLFGLDKRFALRGSRRIPERVLHTFELLGGWPGAFVAARVFRHKSRKTRYLAVLYGIVVLHFAFWCLYQWQGPGFRLSGASMAS
ncbi:DUF1294 domain-containing protein [Ferrimonas marina]|uniref:DUF1294 domain-containing protein n=1 Tax=Ferrimonas marina TaxID=299255 RepID=UPI00190EDE28|nr:DUF1294 domain-containing protein [Ferrimonas marina]